MTHTPAERAEGLPQERQTGGGDGLQLQAAKLLSGPEGSEAQASQQSSQFAQQGLKDLGTQNEVSGILSLMKASQLNPDIVRDQAFFKELKGITGDVLGQGPHDESHHFRAVAVAPEVTADDPARQSQSAAPPESAQTQASQAESTGNADTANIADQSTQLVQQGLSAIAGGDKLTGIVSLMQAAQANPRIMSDPRFQMALQNALAQGSRIPSSDALDQPAEASPSRAGAPTPLNQLQS